MVKHSFTDYKISRKRCNLFRPMRNVLVINVLRLKWAKLCMTLGRGESKSDKKWDRKDKPLNTYIASEERDSQLPSSTL